MRLATQLALFLCGISAFSTGLALMLQERSLAAALEGAARERLDRAASATDQLLEGRLAAMAERYEAISQTPEFRANLDVRDGPTLGFFAKQLVRQQKAALILFLTARNQQRVRSGSKALGQAARAALARGSGNPAATGSEPESTRTDVIAYDGESFAMSVTPLHTRGRLVGRLVAVEPISEEVISGWSELCGARVHFAPSAGALGALDTVVRSFDGLDLRVAGSLDTERKALADSRLELLAAGAIALGLAFAASFMLARRLVRPILEVQDATEKIGRGDLSVRIDAERGDEIGDVARAFNHMVDRLDRTLGEVRYLAYHDSLTGLGNRLYFKERLTLAIAHGRHRELGVAVLFLDLDHFKYVNDTLGHTIGDQLLEQAADRILAALKVADRKAASRAEGEPSSVARFGGDEFTVLLPGLADPQTAGHVARRVLDALAEPFRLGSHEVTMGGTIGISAFPADGQDVETLLRHCDTAMYHAKQLGRNSYQFFAEQMNVIATKRLVLEGKLRRAIESEDLQLHYQPKVDLETGRVVGFEALARWREAELGAIPPDEFVPLAEDSGLIHELGDWVLRAAVAQAAAWQLDGLPPFRVAINLSTHQMERDGVVERIAAVLEQAGVDPERLEIEITESVLMKDEEAAVAILHQLRSLGIHVALDDFGTGYSSLSYLRRLPIDTVKIDQSFIRNVGEDSEDAALASAMISLAKVLQLRVVVEGVETEAQHAFLREIGCDEIQGFLVSSAVPATEVPKLVETLGRGRRPKRPRRRPRRHPR